MMPKILVQKDDHGEYRFLCHNTLELMRARSLFTKEPGTVAWLRGTLRPGEVFYDIGANVGCYTLIASRLVGPSGLVVAFEPHPANAAALLENIALNELMNIVVITTPLCDCNLFGVFGASTERSGSSGHQFGKGGGHLQMQAMTLDFIRAASGLSTPHVIKIDVDGLEPQILMGASIVLGGHALRSVQVEAQPETAAQVRQLLGLLFDGKSYRHDTQQGAAQRAQGKDVAHNLVFTR